MGQRSNTETLFGIVAAFVERNTWRQDELAKQLETSSETVRKYLNELRAQGLHFERDEEQPFVFWSVPKNWFPGVLTFKADEVKDLLRLINRAPAGELRDRVIETTATRLASTGVGTKSTLAGVGTESTLAGDPASTIQPSAISADAERWLAILEDAALQGIAINMRYYSASRGVEQSRHASVHRIDIGTHPQFIATCHQSDELRRFRVDNIVEAQLDRKEPFRKTTPDALTQFDRESFSGFRDVGPSVECIFFVRHPEAAWVAKNLPDRAIEHKADEHGIRFRVETAGVSVLARFVVGLGEVAWPESPELTKEVESIARAALTNATTRRPT
jgi:predicted DNA-binding transcriptional regulator YafY